MKITSAEVFVSSPARNFVTLKVETDAGIYGLGDATLNGRELAVVSILEDHMIPCLIGRDPFDTEDIWQYFYRGVYWRRGPINMAALGAIDVALWDIKGKALGVPVYQLLGGKSREKLMVYTHAQGRDAVETLEEVAKTKEAGYKAIRVQSGVPGLEGVYGVAKDRGAYEPAERGGLPTEERWSTEKYLNFLPSLFEKARKQVGADIHLLHDAHHRLTPIEAARLGKELEPFHLFWLEDAVPAEWQEGFAVIRQHTTTPLAVGEVFNTVYDCQDLISKQMIDYIRMNVGHGGGLTPMMKIASLASFYHVKTGCHGPSDVSPINMAACLHFGTAINNFGIQEYMGYADLTMEVFRLSHPFERGHFTMSDAPGLGVEMNFDLAKKYPYERAYLPINRLEDGTLHNY
ncbi:MAG: D-mannonate dehydratase ManD [Bacteroidota bacterium]